MKNRWFRRQGYWIMVRRLGHIRLLRKMRIVRAKKLTGKRKAYSRKMATEMTGKEEWKKEAKVVKSDACTERDEKDTSNDEIVTHSGPQN
jgi:hypothetical protein